jgi:HPt (histidine-containing phosphotransfer) domain-containing protein
MDAQELKTYIDLDTALGRVRGNKVIYLKMLGMFENSGEFTALEEALAAQDYARGSEVAHGIKGMTGNLGFTRLCDISAEMMVKLREGAPDPALVDVYREVLEKTRRAVEQVKTELA